MTLEDKKDERSERDQIVDDIIAERRAASEKKAKTEAFNSFLKEQIASDETVKALHEEGFLTKAIESRPELIEQIQRPEASLDFYLDIAKSELLLAKNKKEAPKEEPKAPNTPIERDAPIKGSTIPEDDEVVDIKNPAHRQRLRDMGLTDNQIERLALSTPVN